MVLFQRQLNQSSTKKNPPKTSPATCRLKKMKFPDEEKTDLKKHRVCGQMKIAARSCMWNHERFIPDSLITEVVKDGMG